MENYKQIASKAYELYMRYGINSVTMDDIAFQLGMSKKTIYRYFGSKDALVESIIRQKAEENRALFDLQKDTSKDAIELLIDDLKNAYNLFGRLNAGIIFGLEKYHPSAFRILTDYIDSFIFKIIEKDIQLGVDQGFFRKNVDLPIIIHFLLKNLQSIFCIDTHMHPVYHKKTVEIELLNHFIYGIITPKAYELSHSHPYILK